MCPVRHDAFRAFFIFCYFVTYPDPLKPLIFQQKRHFEKGNGNAFHTRSHMRMRTRGCMCAMYIYIIVTLLLSSSRGRKPFSVNGFRGNKFCYLLVTCVTFHFCGFMLDLCMARALIHSCACHNLSATLLTSLGPHLPCVSKLLPDPTIGRRSDGVTRCAYQAGTWVKTIRSLAPSDVIQRRS